MTKILLCMTCLLWQFNIYSQGVFERTYGGSMHDASSASDRTDDGGYIFFGFSNGGTLISSNAWLIKTDANGDTLWTRVYDGMDAEEGQSVQQTSDGGYILGGYTRSFGLGNDDAFLLKLDSAGAVVWGKT